MSTFTYASLAITTRLRSLPSGEPPVTTAPLPAIPAIALPPTYGPAIMRPFLPTYPVVYDKPAIIAPVRPTGDPGLVPSSGAGRVTSTTLPASPLEVPALPPIYKPRVPPPPSAPTPGLPASPQSLAPTDANNTVGADTATQPEPKGLGLSLGDRLRNVPWWGVAAALVVGAAVLFRPRPIAAVS